MQNDSMHHASGTMTLQEAASQDSTTSYNCSHCVLIFKTRIFLYEHLHQVHGLDSDAALRDSGLKSVALSKPKPDNNYKQSEFAFNCKRCNFKSCNWTVYREHKKQCSGGRKNYSAKASPKDENSATISILSKKHKESETKVSIEKATRKSNTKDVIKKYTKSPQTITKYFAGASATKSDYDAGQTDSTTLLLEQSPSNSSGVFQVTAKSIDMAEGSVHKSYLLNDSFLFTDPTLAKPVDHFKEEISRNTGKRAATDTAPSVPSKKSKLQIDGIPQSSNEIQSSSCAELSFEVSEDEDEMDPVSENVEALKDYLCKRCDYSAANLSQVFTHYEDNHPYISYNSNCLQEESDHSVKFRCLECPVEYSSEADLQKHYTGHHPEAPNVFTLKSSELNLVFKCFLCPFASNILHSLREHYKEKHPAQKVENPLMYCKYSSTSDHNRFAQMTFSQEDTSLLKHTTNRMTTPCKEDKGASSLPTPKPKPSDGNVYQCGKCIFSHKSVVVLHVHYKKCHPEEAITLDKIKQSAFGASITESEQKPIRSMEHLYSVKEENNSDSENISAEQQPDAFFPGLNNTSPSHTFFCDLCQFSSQNIRSVVSHHNAKHGSMTTISKILQHNAELKSKRAKNKKASLSKEGDVAYTSVKNPYLRPQDLYYCNVCNYANPNLPGVLNHQSKVHEKNQGTKERVMTYTTMIRDQIEKSKFHPSDSILPSGLPLPLIKDEERNNVLFFCHFCNYRNKDVAVVSRHYLKMHKADRITTQQILEQTSIISDRLQTTSQMKYIEQSQKVIPANPKKKKYSKIKVTKNLKSISGSWTQTHGELKCTACSYKSQFLYLIRKHIQQKHKKSLSYSDIVQHSGPGTNLQPGYYCDICSYFHEDAAEVSRHGKQRHAGRSVSRHFILTQLYVSPDVCNAKNIKDYSVDQSDNIDASSGHKDDEAYSCKACSFKGNSMSSVTSHYRAVHPWCVKEDGSVLDVSKSSKKQSPSRKMQVCDEYSETFDSYQVPLEFDASTVSIEETKEYCCSYCPAKFEGYGGLLIHLGMKHRNEAAKETPQLEMAKRIKIFKCRSCSYVNNIRQGVFAHANMKHPNKKVKFDSLYIGSEHLHNVEKRIKCGTWKICGFMCKVCCQVYSSKEKLKIHREKAHKHPISHVSKSASVPDSTVLKQEEIWCQHCGLYCGSAAELTDHLRVCQKNNSLYICVLCPNAFSTRVRLGIHYTKKHGKKAFFKHYAPLYNQPSKKSTSADFAQLEEMTYSAMEESKTVQMYKCPSCRYVNSVHHGTLTHCQMRHPNIVVRADTLKTVEIHVADMIGCRSSARPNYGGYRCKKCPKVYGVLKKLKKHCETDHSRSAAATSEPLVQSKHPESVDDNTMSESTNQKKPVSKFRHFFKCSLCSYSTLILKQLGNHYTQRHGKSAFLKFYSPLFYQSHKKPKVSKAHEETEKAEKNTEKVEHTPQTTKPVVPTKVYKCSICSYGSVYRRYLIAHYRNRHKLDSQAVYKQMEKYSQDKLITPDGKFKCSKCLDLFFETRWRLLAHYHSFHSSELKLDFTIHAKRTPRTTGVYKCCHCTLKIFGIKKLRCHLDRHRERRLKMTKQNVEMIENNKNVSEQETFPSLETVEDETKLNEKTQDHLITKITPPVSPVKPFAPELSEEPDVQSAEVKHSCLRCKRTFMSLKGLRSHERSHAALAAIKKVNLPTSVIEQHIEKYLVYRPGTTRPFMCNFCPYRTDVHGLWKGHIIKNHQYVLKSAEAGKNSEETTHNDVENIPNMGEDINALDGDEGPENSYLEPTDVQRQLKHYNFMAQIDSASKTQEIHISDPKMLPCEMCNFNSPHISTMRRHYLRHHGKKLIRCKDCNFFTCFRQNLDLHEQMGHSTVQSEPTHQKNLCCPFCLYQSKNKNNMIDHIVLHREERVMPIEVRRSKLSRCLEGVVFRCHKCTFTSGSADSLHLHMAKHNDVKPYKCRLCYYDCTQLRDLEAHLCDKHQVVRNHQLVGQVFLDQLEVRDDRISQGDGVEELLYSRNEEEVLKDITVTLQNEIQNKTNLEDVIEENQKSEPSPNNGEEFTDIPKSQNSFEQSACGRLIDNTDDVQPNPETEVNPPQMKGREDGPESSSMCVKTNDDPSKFQALPFESKIKNDILHHAPELDDNEFVKNQSSNVDGETVVVTNENPQMTTEMINAVAKKNININKSTSVEHKIHEQKSLGAVSKNCNKEDTHNQINSTEQTNLYGEMPILEKYFKEQRIAYTNCETSQTLLCVKTKDKCNERDGDGAKNEDRSQEDHNPPLLFGGLSATDGAAKVFCPPDAAALFPCDLCGRNLGNTSELQHHIMRHGM